MEMGVDDEYEAERRLAQNMVLGQTIAVQATIRYLIERGVIDGPDFLAFAEAYLGSAEAKMPEPCHFARQVLDGVAGSIKTPSRSPPDNGRRR